MKPKQAEEIISFAFGNRYRASQALGIPQATLSRVCSGERKITGTMRRVLLILAAFAESVAEDIESPEFSIWRDSNPGATGAEAALDLLLDTYSGDIGNGYFEEMLLNRRFIKK